nr:TonB-dependent receptor [Pseudomarimonas arenosa]
MQIEAGDASATELADLLDRLPGLYARSRGNFAQDLQLSARGHGTRSSFGIRSLRLYIDGIPASAPDGQGQLSQLPPGFAGDVHFASGPLAAFYGNAGGGLLRFVSAPIEGGGGQLAVRGGRAAQGISVQCDWEAGWRASLSRFELQGPRPHSRARRDHGAASWQWQPTADGAMQDLDVRLDHFNSPFSQDPLGLSAEQFAEDPFGTSPNAQLYNTRKRSRQSQLGLHGKLNTSLGQAQLASWIGQRAIEQYLAVPPTAQANPRSGGGVIDLRRDFSGIELDHRFGRGEAALSLGLRLERQDETRLGFENFVGSQLGVRGALRRNERNRVDSADPYLLLEWWPRDDWQLATGLRHSRLRYRSIDRFVNVDNPDDSGQRQFTASIPMLALGYLGEQFRWGLAWARGFEAPTGVELAYRADGESGFNTELRPARSQLLEVSAGWQSAASEPALSADLSLFNERLRDELVVLQSSAGRSVFGNVEASRRRGIEASGRLRLTSAIELTGNATWLDARFVGGALDGRRLPAVAPRFARLGLQWQGRSDWLAELSLQAGSGVFVDDRNSLRTAGHSRWDLRIERRLAATTGQAVLALGLDNLLDRHYVGSVIVNESNGRFLETAAGRELSLELRWAY